ncbi:MAG: HAMP domain-containing histidine kinase [Clostridia bacterium]|nr:HAMP domain-containing histidine kinase [Clostridia bacterium]
MKRTLKGSKKYKQIELGRVRRGMIFSWIFSLIIPIVIITAFNVLTYGDNALKVITHPNFFNRYVFQLKELNEPEYLSKTLENLVIDEPSEAALSKEITDFKNTAITEANEDMYQDMMVLVRKNARVVFSQNFGTLSEKQISGFQRLSAAILPPFQPGRSTNNEMLFHETGYVISRQMDFYFDDHSKGSIFILRKYTNVPGKIAAIVGKNILYVIALMFLFHTLFAVRMSKRFTRPLKNMITATEEVMAGNYEYQIPIERKTVLRLLSSALNDMIEELNKGKLYRERMEATRSEFIANLSHDMKTPLTSIKIHAQAIKDGIVNTPEKMDKYIDNILKKSSDMDVMLDELKIFSELSLGTGNYAMDIVNFEYFLMDVVDELKYDVNAKDIELLVESNVTHPFLKFDPTKIKRLITNITFNSVKYAEKRPLKILFELSELLEESQHCIQLVISDNGRGVSDDKLEKIFDQHYRVDPARNQTISGSGLGLSIAKSIIEHHGGSIMAQRSALGGLAIVINFKCEVNDIEKNSNC